MYVTWEHQYATHYSRQQLQNMHLNFMQPSVSKLLNLLERAYPDQVTQDTKEIFKDSFDACQIFQTYSSKPITFQVRFPDEVVLNKTIRMDLMFIDGAPILHVIEAGMNFSAARFVTAEDTETIWSTYLYTWVTVYIGYPHDILTDQGSAFTVKEWQERRRSTDIRLRGIGKESHNYLGQGETYHSMLRRV